LALALPNQQQQRDPAANLANRVAEALVPAISQALGIHQSQGSRVGAGLNNLQVFGPGRGANPGHGATPVRGELGAADGLAAECHTPAPKALQDKTPSPPTAAPSPPAATSPPPASASDFKNAEQDLADFEEAKEHRDRKQLKRPAAASEATASKPSGQSSKGNTGSKPSGQSSKGKVSEHAPKKGGKNRPPMMKAGDATVFYKEGKINRNEGSKKFRVFLKVGDRSDKAVSWKTCSPQEAWSKACLLLEEASSGR